MSGPRVAHDAAFTAARNSCSLTPMRFAMRAGEIIRQFAQIAGGKDRGGREAAKLDDALAKVDGLLARDNA